MFILNHYPVMITTASSVIFKNFTLSDNFLALANKEIEHLVTEKNQSSLNLFIKEFLFASLLSGYIEKYSDDYVLLDCAKESFLEAKIGRLQICDIVNRDTTLSLADWQKKALQVCEKHIDLIDDLLIYDQSQIVIAADQWPKFLASCDDFDAFTEKFVDLFFEKTKKFHKKQIAN